MAKTIVTVDQGGTGATALTDNSILTGTGASAITAEANLTFSGSVLNCNGTAEFEDRVTVKKASNSEVQVVSSNTSITLDMDAADNFSLTLDNDAILENPTGTPVPGQSGCIVITQGSIDGGTMDFGSEWLFESDGGAILLSEGEGKVDNLVYYVAKTDAIHAVLLKDFV